MKSKNIAAFPTIIIGHLLVSILAIVMSGAFNFPNLSDLSMDTWHMSENQHNFRSILACKKI